MAAATQRKTAAKVSKESKQQQQQQHSSTTQTTPPKPASTVLLTLLAFSAAMLAFPLGTYFVAVDRLFSGNATVAGALAALMANVVLIGYVVVAWRDDQAEQLQRQQQQQQQQSLDMTEAAAAGSERQGDIQATGDANDKKTS